MFGAGSDPRSDLMLGILGSLAEFEREIIRERQAEGIAAAKSAAARCAPINDLPSTS